MKICLAGTGAMGVIHAKALAKIDGVEIVSIASRTGESGKAFAAEYQGFRSRPRTSAVHRSPGRGRGDPDDPERPASRPDDSLALGKGKHVQVEIPMALGLKDSEEMLAAARKAGKVCMVTHTRRFSAPHREMKKRIREGTFHLHHLVVETYFFRRTNLNMHGQPRSWVDNLLWHHGCHSVDIAQWVIDNSNWDAWGQKGPDHKELGIPMDLSVCMKWRGARCSRWRCRSTTRARSAGSTATSARKTHKIYRDSMTDSEGKEVALDPMLAFDRQDVEFVSAIREGREPESSAASVVPTMALLDKIDRAMNR